MRYICIIFLIIFSPVVAWAGCTETSPGIWEPDTLTVSDVQTCVNNADSGTTFADGDTVLLPSGSATWTSRVTINKNIKILGAGEGTTIITNTSTDTFRLATTATCGPEIGDMTIKQNNSVTEGSIRTDAYSQYGVVGFYIHDIHFWKYTDDNSRQEAIWFSTSVVNAPQQSGVISECTFENTRVNFTGSTSYYSALHDDGKDLGTSNNVFVEDCDFTWTHGTDATSAKTCLDSQDSRNWVFRFNNTDDCYVLAHPCEYYSGVVRRGLRWWAVYNNTMDYSDLSDQWASPIRLRSGSGVVFGNNFTGDWPTEDLVTDIKGQRDGHCDGGDPWDGDGSPSGYPCRDQIGRPNDDSRWDSGETGEGEPPSQTLYPAYFWDNDGGHVTIKSEYSTDASYIVQNQDYYDDDDSHMQSGTYVQMQAVSSPSDGDGFWVTDRGGDWCDDDSDNCPDGDSQDGALYVYDGSNWAEYYVPYDYPHPLITGAEDETAPVINNASPSGTLSCTEDPRTITMSLTTDESATCKYSTSDLAYDSMENTFSTTGGTSHSQSLSVSCGSLRKYYVRCEDGSGNANSSSTTIQFSVESGSEVGFNMTYNADSAPLGYGAGSAPLTLQ